MANTLHGVFGILRTLGTIGPRRTGQPTQALRFNSRSCICGSAVRFAFRAGISIECGLFASQQNFDDLRRLCRGSESMRNEFTFIHDRRNHRL
jgi:hypothetical protein